MKIDLIISADDIKEEKIKDKSIVVIDMLRATTVIITAMSNGAKRVVPFLTVEEAVAYSSSDREQFILGGERRALKIENFDLSNSPLEYTENVVKDKDVVITTTNGTRTIKGCEKAKDLIIGAFINAKAVVNKLIELNNEVVFVNAGTNGQFSMDDFICAGYMIHLLSSQKQLDMTDIAFTAKNIYESHTDIISFIKDARHFNVIRTLGLEKDLEYCLKKDIINLVPIYKNGEITVV